MSNSAVADLGVGVILAALVGAGGVLYGATISEARGYIYPDCSDARGLRPISSQSLSASGPGIQSYGADKAIDGYLGSQWSPPTVAPKAAKRNGLSPFIPVYSREAGDSALQIAFKDGKDRDVLLVCANNGLASGDERYENWGKVRTVTAWTGEQSSSDARTAVLQNLSVDRSESYQEVARDLGPITELNIEVVDAYAGKEVISHDPDRCSKFLRKRDNPRRDGHDQDTFARGCILASARQAGLSEVILYEDDPADGPPFPWSLFA